MQKYSVASKNWTRGFIIIERSRGKFASLQANCVEVHACVYPPTHFPSRGYHPAGQACASDPPPTGAVGNGINVCALLVAALLLSSLFLANLGLSPGKGRLASGFNGWQRYPPIVFTHTSRPHTHGGVDERHSLRSFHKIISSFIGLANKGFHFLETEKNLTHQHNCIHLDPNHIRSGSCTLPFRHL